MSTQQVPIDEGADEDEKVDPEQMFTVLVRLRHFLMFLNSHVINSQTTIACTSTVHFPWPY